MVNATVTLTYATAVINWPSLLNELEKSDDVTRKLTRLSLNTQSLSTPVQVGQKRPSLMPQLNTPNKIVCQNTSTSKSTKDVRVNLIALLIDIYASCIVGHNWTAHLQH